MVRIVASLVSWVVLTAAAGAPAGGVAAPSANGRLPVAGSLAQAAAPSLPAPSQVAPAQPAPATVAADAPAAISPATAVSPTYADIMATGEKPKGFAYNLMNGSVVAELNESYLYIKSSPQSKISVTVPVPKNREFFNKCITGGTFEDLVHGAVVNVKYDPAGNVRPVIEIVEKVVVEVYEDARILDRGGKRIYIRAADGREKGFELDGGPAAWDQVIEGAKFADLVPGSIVRVEHDPGGRTAIRIIFKRKPADLNADGSKKSSGRGCGCDVRAKAPLGGGEVGLALLVLALWVSRRR